MWPVDPRYPRLLVVSHFLAPPFQSRICSLMILAAASALCCRPMASTKSPSGSTVSVSTTQCNFPSVPPFPSPPPTSSLPSSCRKDKRAGQKVRRKIEEGQGKGKQRTHQVEIDTMIHQIIHPRRRPLRRAEVDAVFSAHVLDLLPGAREADDRGVEFGEVAVQHGGRVPCGIAGYEDGEERGAWGGLWGWRLRGRRLGG